MGIKDKQVMDERIAQGEKAERKQMKKELKAKMKKERVSFFADFKKFITKGNVLDMAVGVVIGTAFNAIVNGLVKFVITPFVTYFTSGVSIDEWEYVMRPELLDEAGEVVQTKISIQYGLWLQAILDFLIIALTVFVAVRVIRSMERKLNQKEILAKEAEEAKKKAEADAKAAAAAEEAARVAAEKKAIEDEFYENVREQSRLLKEISQSLKK